MSETEQRSEVTEMIRRLWLVWRQCARSGTSPLLQLGVKCLLCFGLWPLCPVGRECRHLGVTLGALEKTPTRPSSI
jgi:hypothetical protein